MVSAVVSALSADLAPRTQPRGACGVKRGGGAEGGNGVGGNEELSQSVGKDFAGGIEKGKILYALDGSVFYQPLNCLERVFS